MKSIFRKIFKKQRHAERTNIQDVFFDPKKRVVNLRKKAYRVEIDFSHIFYFFRKNKYALYAIGAILLVCVTLQFPLVGRASIAHFYSTSCLGGWKNSELAQGKPQVTHQSGATYNESNSAVLSDGISQIFCGNFEGEVPQDSESKKVYVAFSIGTEGRASAPDADNAGSNSKEQLISDELSATTTIEGTDFSSSTREIIDSVTGSTTEFRLLPNESSVPLESEPVRESQAEPSVEVVPSREEAQLQPHPQPQLEPVIQSQPAPTESTEPSDVSAFFHHILAAPYAYADTVEEGFLDVLFTIDGTTWKSLGKITASQLASLDRMPIPDDEITGWDDLSRLQISIQRLPTIDAQPAVFLDSVWLEVEYDRIKNNITVEDAQNFPKEELPSSEGFTTRKKDFLLTENPVFEIDLNSLTPEEVIEPELGASSTATSSEQTSSLLKSIFSMYIRPLASLSFRIAQADTVSQKKILKAEVYYQDGTKADVEPRVTEELGKVKVTVPKPTGSFRPGKYKLRLEVLDGYKVLVTTQDFTWGVLAVNTNKSVYTPEEEIYFQMGALTEDGHTICDARLQLDVLSPDGKVAIFKTDDGNIIQSPTCGPNNVTDEPDYKAFFIPKKIGSYTLKLTNLENGYEVKNTFDVKKSVIFDVERVSATRINPFKSTYKMTLRVHASEAFKGELVEKVPSSFEVVSATPSADISKQWIFFNKDGTKEIRWNIELSKGESKEFSYIYDAPRISPQLFVAGPLELVPEKNTDLGFVETRNWQIASDAACNAVATGNWNDGTKFSGCTGAGGTPASSDTVTINAGVKMTVTANATVAGLTVAANSSGSTDNGILVNSGVTFTVTATTTINAPTATNATATVDAGDGTLNIGGASIVGSATAGRNSTLSVTNGSIVVSGSVAFSGTTAQARTRISGTGSMSITGSLGATAVVGTVVSTGTGTYIFNGTGAQTIASSANFYNIQVDKSAGTATFSGTTLTLGGALTVTNGTLAIAGQTPTIAGTTTVSGTLNFTSTTGTKIFTGPVIVTSTGTWNNSANEGISFRGGLTNHGTFTSGSGTYTFDTNSQTFFGTASTTITNLTVTGVTLTNTSTSTLKIATALAGTGTTTQGTGAVLEISGTSAITGLSATASGNTVIYSGAAQTVKAVAYHHLTLTGSGVKTITSLSTINGDLTIQLSTAGTISATTAANIAVGGNLSVGSNATLTVAGFAFSVGGTTDIISGGTLAHSSSVGAKTYTGQFTLTSGSVTNAGGATITFHSGIEIASGTFSLSSGSAGTAVFDTNNQSITSTSVIPTFYNVQVNGISLTNTTSGSAYVSISNSLSGTGEWIQDTNSLVSVGKDMTVSTLTASATNNTVEYAGSSTQILKGTTYHHLRLSSSNTVTMNGNIDVSSLTLSGGSTLVDGGWTITPAASSTFVYNSGWLKLGSTTIATSFPSTFTRLPATVSAEYLAGVEQTVYTGIPYTNLTISGFARKVTTDALTVTGTLDVSTTGGSVEMLRLSANHMHSLATVTIGGGVTVSHPSLTGNNTTITGNLTVSGSLSVTSTLILQGNASGAGSINSGILKVTGGATQTLGVTLHYYSSLVVEKTPGTSASITVSPPLFSKDCTITSGELIIGNITITILGETIINDTLTINGTTGTKIFTEAVTIGPSGTWNNSINEAVTFRGGLTNNGTFTAGTATYTFDTNSQSLNGSQSIIIDDISIPSSISLTNNASTTILTGIAGAGSFIQGNSGILDFRGSSIAVTTFNASASGNTVYYGGSTQTLELSTYHTLILAGSGAKTWSSITTINGNLILTDSAIATTTAWVAVNVGGTFDVGTSTRFAVNTGGFSVTGTTTVAGRLETITNVDSSISFLRKFIITSSGIFDDVGFRGINLREGIENYGSLNSRHKTTFNTNTQSIQCVVSCILTATTANVNVTNNGLIDMSTLAVASSYTFTQGAGSIATISSGISGLGSVDFSTATNTVKYSEGSGIKATTYHNLFVTSSTSTLAGTTTVANDVVIQSGAGIDISTSNYGLTVKGNWIKTGGFNARSGTVTFDGTAAQSLSGSTNWYGLIISASSSRTVSFESGATQSVAANGRLILRGSSGQLLTLAPLTPASQWNLQVSTSNVSQIVSYVSASYSNAGPANDYAQISASDGTNTDGGNNTNWNFLGSLTFSLSNNTCVFGTLSAAAPRYATCDGSGGSSSETEAHTISASSDASGGYTISVRGSTLAQGGNTITAIGGTNAASSPGFEQFGLRLVASGGIGSVTSPYANSGFAYAASASTPSQIASAGAASAVTTVYSVRYIANIGADTESGGYSTTMTYVMTANY